VLFSIPALSISQPETHLDTFETPDKLDFDDKHKYSQERANSYLTVLYMSANAHMDATW